MSSTINNIQKLPSATEEQWLQQVIQVARIYGWTHYHTRDSRRSAAGYPDLCLVRERPDGWADLIFAELKTDKGRVTPAQQWWLHTLGLVPGIRVFLWRPAQFQEIADILRGSP